MMAGIFYGAMYGGSTTSILLNIPGEVASVPTCLDGYPMAQQGKSGTRAGDLGHRVLSSRARWGSLASLSLRPFWLTRP